MIINDNIIIIISIIIIIILSSIIFIYYKNDNYIKYITLFIYLFITLEFSKLEDDTSRISQLLNLKIDFNGLYSNILEYSLYGMMLFFILFLIKDIFIDPFFNKN